MEPKSFRSVEQESDIVKRLINRLTLGGWYCKRTHGNEFQEGFPDLFICKMQHGSRWVEVKRPKGYAFTEAQLREFPKFTDNGIGIWVLTDSTDYEINKLFRPCNWHWYLDVMKAVSRPRARIDREVLERKKRLASSGPERDIQESVKLELQAADWLVKETHGNIYQSGLPDLYAWHKRYGARWVEIKCPTGYAFTPAQMKTFPMFTAHGVGVWILDGPNQIDRLDGPANWYSYLSIMKS